MTLDVTSIKGSDWAFKLKAHGEVVAELEDISQCIDIILGTPKGSDPLRPAFGCDAFLWLDKPISLALPNIKLAVFEALATWEPRATVTAITHEVVGASIAILVSWEAQGVSGENRVSYAAR